MHRFFHLLQLLIAVLGATYAQAFHQVIPPTTASSKHETFRLYDISSKIHLFCHARDKAIDCRGDDAPPSFSIPIPSPNRREILTHWCLSAGLLIQSSKIMAPSPANAAAEPAADLAALRARVTEARKQLEAVPDLIKAEKWDSIRAILITPPLSDCWGKSSGSRPLLQSYAEAIGEAPDGDELAALEAKEDVVTHLRFLDMAAYNNVFNPIKTEGESGATKGLIKSYYEDPVNELKASTTAMDELVRLGAL